MQISWLSPWLKVSISAALLALLGICFSILPNFAQSPLAQTEALVLTGRVTADADGSPISDVGITLVDPGFPGFFEVARTDSSGYYTVTDAILERYPNIIPATWKIRFDPNSAYLSEYYDDTDYTGAKELRLTVDSVTSGIDASLALGGLITGTIFSDYDNHPLAGANVSLYNLAGENVNTLYSIDSTGAYTFTGVVKGAYKIGAVPSYLDTFHVGAYYPDTQWLSEAQTIEVEAGETVSNINIVLALGGQISGSVTSNIKELLVGPLIDVYDSKGRLVPSKISGPDNYSNDVLTEYVLSNLLPGSYRLFIHDKQQEHRPEYYNDQLTLDAATPVSVTAGQVTPNINAELALTPTVSSIATSGALSNTILISLGYNSVPIYTTDGGQTWGTVLSAPWAMDNLSQSVLVGLTPRKGPGSPIRMLVLTNGSGNIYRSDDHGWTWSEQTLPLKGCTGQDQYFTEITPAFSDPTQLYVLNYCYYESFPGEAIIKRLFLSRDAGISWHSPVTDDASSPDLTYVTKVVPSPVITERVYALGYQWLRSDDGGNHWSTEEFPVDDLVLDAKDAAWLYGIPSLFGPLTEPRTAKRSEDGGDHWIAWAGLPCALAQSLDEDDEVLQLMSHPTQTRVLFLRCVHGLYRSDDGGDHWTKLSDTPGQLLAPDYGAPNRILWVKNDGLWASTDNGDTWSSMLSIREMLLASAQSHLFLPLTTRK